MYGGHTVDAFLGYLTDTSAQVCSLVLAVLNELLNCVIDKRSVYLHNLLNISMDALTVIFFGIKTIPLFRRSNVRVDVRAIRCHLR